MEYFIRIISGTAPVQKYKIEPGETLIGRSRSAGIRVKDPDVSGKHFLLRFNGGDITVENLSSSGTRLDDQMLFETVQVKSGQHIYAGATLDCIIEDEELTAENDARTFSGAFDPDPVTEDQTSASAGGTENSGTANETGHGTASGTENKTSDSHNTGTASDTDHSEPGTGRGDTVANKTRVATPDEIQYIKDQKKKRFNRVKTVRILLLLLVAAAVVMLCFREKKEPVSELTWAKKADGQWNTGAVSLPGMEIKNGGFAVFYPEYSKSSVAVQKNFLEINTFLGADAEVPLRIVLSASTLDRHLDVSLSADLKNWMRDCGSDPDSRWIFENISSMQFFGTENGLPSLSVSYVRESKNESSCGIARIFRQGATAYILRAEVPFAEKDRAGKILNSTHFLLFSRKFVADHWEGGIPALALDSNALLRLRNEISNASPARLARLQRIICGVLVQAVKTKDAGLEESALGLLRVLREEQKICFNTLKIKYVNAMLEHDRAAAEKIRAESAAVFSLSSDKRFYDIRQNLW